jgi:hypothetical protein
MLTSPAMRGFRLIGEICIDVHVWINSYSKSKHITPLNNSSEIIPFKRMGRAEENSSR